jgi:AcrR family transcriptional regulator
MQDPALADESLVAERVVRGAIESFRTHPFHDVTPEIIAEAAGVPVRALCQAFPMWDALLMVTYDRWVEQRAAARRGHPRTTLEFVRMTLEEDVADPGLVRVLAGAINIAGSRTGFAELFRKRYEEYHVALVAGLTRDFETGAETSVVPAEHAATQLLALYEGLQIQMLVRPHVDVVREYDLAAQTLRTGWASRPVQTWDLGG